MLRTAFAVFPALLALGCKGAFPSAAETPRGFHGNLLENPGFEAGEAGWTYPVESPYWGKFDVVESPVHSGRRAAHLRLRAGPEDGTNRVWIEGVMQEPAPERFPDVMGGFYRVDKWEKGADVTDLYLQGVAIVWTKDAARVVTPGNPEGNAGLSNYQLRFYLAGITEPPFLLANAKVAFVAKGEPELGRWTYFEIPLREEFLRQWGAVPAGYEKIRVLFEARWDNRPPGSRVEADAYFDDLFLGYVDEVP
jgi:hypothetical protein